MTAAHEEGFSEVADGCFVARYLAWDTTIGAVVGSDGVLVVDTRATLAHGREIQEHLWRIAPNRPIRWVVDTHEHFDHVLGNAAFDDATVIAHEVAADQIADAVEHIRRQIRAEPDVDPSWPGITPEVYEGVLTSPIRLPDVTFSSVRTVDLGDRYVELLHPGRGHTGGDIVVRAPDADVVFAGDLIEQSAPPSYGTDCYPMDWAASLDIVVGILTDKTVVSPGHGSVVDREFVEEQRENVARVAEVIRSLFAAGVPEDQAVEAARSEWPFEDHPLEAAVARGYAQLREAGTAPPEPGLRSLPLV
jgi:glyoxylase-like metal-dependent hydrolase (beta-lactamase superfamily II)